MAFRKVTNKKEIESILDTNMYAEGDPIIPAVFVKIQNPAFEGPHVSGKFTDIRRNTIKCSFTNSDSNYVGLWFSATLEDIEWIEVF